MQITTGSNVEKLDFISRQLARTYRKRFEQYVITRIWHLLDDTDIKIITQQYIVRPNGRALADLYFPQFSLHIEVDEEYHLNQSEQDKLRDSDIINATGHEIIRISTSKGLQSLNEEIEQVVQLVKYKKQNCANFIKWDLGMEQDSNTYIQRGYIDLSDDVAFDKIVSAVNCFGHNYAGWQRGGASHAFEEGTIIWFPKLFPNGEWDNIITDDENTIYERNVNDDKAVAHIEKTISEGIHTRIVFAKVKDSLGKTKYRFKGKYTLSVEETDFEKGLVWKRVATRVRTYKCAQ
jgi:very-short-patch-repair endonuclease